MGKINRSPDSLGSPRRNRFQFRLRSLLILVAIVAAAAAWQGWRIRRVVDRVRQMGGTVEFGKPADGPAAGLIERLANVWGEEYFFDVVSVRLARTDLKDDDLTLLQAFPRLEQLDIQSTAVSDAGLMHLKNFRSLRMLRHWCTPTTRAGWEQLHQSLPELKTDRRFEFAIQAIDEEIRNNPDLFPELSEPPLDYPETVITGGLYLKK